MTKMGRFAEWFERIKGMRQFFVWSIWMACSMVMVGLDWITGENWINQSTWLTVALFVSKGATASVEKIAEARGNNEK